jgi:RNase P/RNase MRP subunit POP5
VQAKSEGVKFKEGEELPETIDFLDFIFEVCLLFDSLGKAGFSFVKSDLETKSGIIRVIHDKNPEANHTLQQVNHHSPLIILIIPIYSFPIFVSHLFIN